MEFVALATGMIIGTIAGTVIMGTLSVRRTRRSKLPRSWDWKLRFWESHDGLYAMFDNGWTLSVQWHSQFVNTRFVEIAAWNKEDTVWWNFEEDEPRPPNSYTSRGIDPVDLPKYMNQIGSLLPNPIWR